MEVDPDYAFEAVEEHQPKTKIGSRFLEYSACEQAKDKIRKIIKEQFTQEILRKEEEAALITDRLVETRQLLDRLRACIVASYYASSFTKPLEKNKGPVPGTAQHPAIQNILRKAVTSVLSKNSPVDNIKVQKESVNQLHQLHIVNEDLIEDALPCPNDVATGTETEITDSKYITSDTQIHATPKKSKCSLLANTTQTDFGARHRIKKTVIVGNVSKYIPPDKREGNDKSTHKWMVYVRGSKDEPRIDHFVRKVWFFLHPSYRPNDLVEVTEAPFHLTRRGWGEFPIRCQLHFCDPRNRRVDIIHNLRLDRTYTGLQTLGAETVCNVELDQSTIDLRIDRFLNQPVPDKVLENKQNKADTDITQNEFDGTVSQDEPMKTEENDAENTKDTSPSLDGQPQGSSPSEVGQADTQMALVNEKKKRRRRGDSCALADCDDTHEAKKGLREDLADEKMEDTSSADNEVIQEPETSKSESPQPQPSSVEVKVELVAPSDTANTEAIESQSPPATQPTTQSPPPTSTSTSSSGGGTPTGTPPKSLSLPATPVRSKTCVILTASPKPLASKGATGATTDAARPRSVSADSGAVVAQSTDSGKLVVLQRGGDGQSRCHQLLNVSSGGGAKQQVVVLRGRSQSSAGEATKLGAQPGQNYTVLKRISIPGTGQSSATSPRKRQLQLSPGSVVLSVVPEKQIKLSLPEKRRSSTDALGGQKIVSTTLLTSPGISSSGPSAIVPAAGRPFVGENPTHSSQPKSFIVKNTKQGLVLVSDKQQSAKPYQLPAATVKTKADGKVVKGLSQQQLISLKALQTALLGAGVSINKPVQVKLEKPQGGQQQAKPLQKTPQFVLTTVTDGQGKQQLALVSADHLKQKIDGSGKDSVYKHVGKQDQLNPINIQAKPKENLPFYKMVACTIMKNKVVDLVEDTMPLAGTLVPLVQHGHQVQQLPFAAESESDFLEWNVGKQRAAEWQRASLVQRILAFIKQTKKLDQNLLSKRSIVNWFLKRGYSVFTDEYEGGAGNELQASEYPEATTATEVKPFGLAHTITAHTGLLQQLRDTGLCEATNDDDEGEVDVVGYAPPKFVKQEFVQESDAFDAKDCPEFRTPEVLAAEMAAKDVGVKFASVPVTTEVSAPLCQAVLANALKSFCQEMLRECLACAIERRDGAKKLQRILPAAITVEDVIGSVIQCNKLSLVSDKFIGI